jgi:hypothetical protein
MLAIVLDASMDLGDCPCDWPRWLDRSPANGARDIGRRLADVVVVTWLAPDQSSIPAALRTPLGAPVTFVKAAFGNARKVVSTPNHVRAVPALT